MNGLSDWEQGVLDCREAIVGALGHELERIGDREVMLSEIIRVINTAEFTKTIESGGIHE